MASNESIVMSYWPAIEARFIERGGDYADAYELLGAKGQFSDINRKFWKLYRGVWLGHELSGEQSDEIAEDIIGHCLLLIHLLHATPDGDDGPQDAFDEGPGDDCADSEWDEAGHLRDRNRSLEEKLKDRTARVIELERLLADYGINSPRRLAAPESGRSSPTASGVLLRDERGTSDREDRPDDAKLQAVHVHEMIEHALNEHGLIPGTASSAIWHGICDAFNIDRTERPRAS
jgi:hypothetical protein